MFEAFIKMNKEL